MAELVDPYTGNVHYDCGRHFYEFAHAITKAAALIDRGEYNQHFWGLQWEGPGVVNVDLTGTVVWPSWDPAWDQFDTRSRGGMPWVQVRLEDMWEHFKNNIPRHVDMQLSEIGRPISAVKVVHYFQRCGSGRKIERWVLHVFYNCVGKRCVLEYGTIGGSATFLCQVPHDFAERTKQVRIATEQLKLTPLYHGQIKPPVRIYLPDGRKYRKKVPGRAKSAPVLVGVPSVRSPPGLIKNVFECVMESQNIEAYLQPRRPCFNASGEPGTSSS